MNQQRKESYLSLCNKLNNVLVFCESLDAPLRNFMLSVTQRAGNCLAAVQSFQTFHTQCMVTWQKLGFLEFFKADRAFYYISHCFRMYLNVKKFDDHVTS